MARVKTVNLVYHYGDTFDDYSVIWLDSSEVPINLTGYTATLRIKDKAGAGATQLLQLSSTTADGLTIVAAAGRIDFSATATKMKSGTLVQNTVYYYDLQVATPSSADVKTLIKGQIWIDPEVTDV